MIRFQKFARALAKLGGVAILLLLPVQVGVVIGRYVFSVGEAWTYDLALYLFALACVLPTLLVVLQNENVRVDVLYENYPRRFQRKIDRLGLILLLAPASAFTVFNYFPFVRSSWKLMETSPTLDGLPGFFILKTVLWLTFCGLAALGVLLALRNDPWLKGQEGGIEQ